MIRGRNVGRCVFIASINNIMRSSSQDGGAPQASRRPSRRASQLSIERDMLVDYETKSLLMRNESRWPPEFLLDQRAI